MTVLRWTAALAVAACTSSPGCGTKKKPTTAPTTDGDGVVADGQPEAKDSEPAKPWPPQDPDPAEIALGRHEVLLGHYDEAVALLEPLYTDLKAREQYRAGGLAGAWLAIAHAQIVYEKAAEPIAHATAMAEKTSDAEVLAAAKLARGALLLAEGDHTAATESLTASAAADPTSPESILALVWNGEALIGHAFNGGSTIVSPEDLDTAKLAYDQAKAAAVDAGPEKDILLGRAQEGLAAVADYQRDKAALCTNAFASIDHYNAAGAADFLVSGPTDLASKYRCKP